MFESVNNKFSRAQYFLDQINSQQVGVTSWRANLDAFFFELVSAKDFFLQALNDTYHLGLKKTNATNLDRIKSCLECKGLSPVVKVVKNLGIELNNKQSWLWTIVNYRNSSTHRELLHLGYQVGETDHTHVYLFKDPEDSSKVNADIEVLPYCQQSFDKLKQFLETLFVGLGSSA